MSHRKIISCVAVALGLGVASLAGAGGAAAQYGDDFLYDVRNNGRIAGPEDRLLELGALACTNHRNNVAPDETITAIGDMSNLSSSSDAVFIYQSALIFLC